MKVGKFSGVVTHLAVFRTSLFDKLNLRNTFSCPQVVWGSVLIELKSLESFDSSRLVAAVFILRLLSKNKPYVARFGLFQTFKEKDYDMSVRVDLRGIDLIRFIELLAYDILPFLPKADLIFNALKIKDGFIVDFIIMDLSFLRVVETHSTFFKWHDKIKIKLFVSLTGSAILHLLLSLLKLNVASFGILQEKGV